MRTYVLPVILAVFILLTALISSAQNYKTSGSVTLADIAMIFAAIAVGVVTERLYETDKKVEKLIDELQKKESEEKSDR